MIRYIQEIFSGLWSLLVGMKLTARHALSPTITMHYPFQTPELSPAFRGHTDLVIDPETGGDRCIVCLMCQNTCPSQCIEVIGEKPEGSKKKILTQYHLDFTKCSLCGNCVEVCPTNALEYSKEYQLTGFSRHDFHFELLGRLRERVKLLGIVPKAAEPQAEPAPKPMKAEPGPAGQPVIVS